jgi:Uri superfamily endonuclease
VGVVGQVSEWHIDYIEYEASAMTAYLESHLGCVALGC